MAAALADMDANAANYLLGALNQNAQADAAFETDRSSVAQSLITAAQNITYGDAERKPIHTIDDQLGSYFELIGKARMAHGQRDDATAIGAYRDATTLMATKILPAARDLDNANFTQLNQAYDTERASAGGAAALVSVTGLLLVGMLVAIQIILLRRTRRLLNLPLLAATLIALVFLLRLVAILGGERDQVHSAKADAFDSLHALWQARAVANDAHGDESRYLLDAERSGTYQNSFTSKSAQLATYPAGQNAPKVAQAAGPDPSHVDLNRLPAGFKGYLADELRNITYSGEKQAALSTLLTFGQFVDIEQKIRDLERLTLHQQAVAQVIGYSQNQSNGAFKQFDDALGKTVDINQQAFDQAIEQAFSLISGVEYISLAVVLAISVLAVIGTYPRIAEYSA
jgi:hypothetical protein